MAETDLLNSEVREVPCKAETDAAAALHEDADLSDGVPAADTASADEHLCEVTLFDSESNTNWTGDALTTTVQELNAALSNENGHAPDSRRVLDILSQLNPQDVQRVDAAYEQIFGHTLRSEIQEKIPGDYRKAELVLKGDYAAQAAYAFEQKDAGYLMMLMSTLPSTEIETLKTDFAAQYGAQFGTFENAVDSNILGAADRFLIKDVFGAGSDALKPEFRRDAAIEYLRLLKENPLSSHMGDLNLERFDFLIGGVKPNDFLTRSLLNANPQFVADYTALFQPGWGAGIPADERFQAAKDLLQDGKISLASLIRQNSYQGLESIGSLFNGGYKGANWDAIDAAIKGIDEVHRADYLAGKELAAAHAPETWGQLPFEQRRQVMYYDQLERAFKDRGDDTQEVVWRDMLLNGDKTLVSKLAELNRDGGNIDDFMQVMAGVTAEDWKLLQPANGSPSEYRAAIDGVVGSIQNPEIQAKVRELVDAFAAKEGYDSTVAQLDFLSTLRNNKDNQQDDRFVSIASALLKMSPDEAALYADPNSAFRAEVDAVIFPTNVAEFNFTSDGKEGVAAALAQRLLKHVAEHGALPTELDEEMTFMKGIMEGTIVDQSERTRMMNEYLGNEETRAKMQLVLDSMRGAISAEDLASITPEDYANYWYVFGLQGTNMDFHTAIQNGGVSSDAQIQSGEGVGEGEGIYTDILRNEQYNQEYIEDMPGNERALLEYVRAQGTMDFVAQARAFALNSSNAHDYQYFVEQLATKSPDEIAAFLETYKTLHVEGAEDSSAVSSDFAADFLTAAQNNDRVSADVLEVLAKIADQGMQVHLEDRIRLAVLSGEKNYQQFLPELEALDQTESGTYNLRTGYAQYGDVAGDLLSMIDHNESDRVKYSELLKVGDSDPRVLMLAQYEAMDLSGWDTDGTREAMVEAMRDKQHLLADYYAARENIPQDVLDELDAQFYAAVQANRDSKASAAEMVDQMISWTVAITAIGAIPFSGGTSLMFTGGAMAVSASRPFVMPSVLGEQMTEDQFKQQLATMGFELATLSAEAVFQAFTIVKAAKGRPALSTALAKLSDDAVEAPVSAQALTVVADDIATAPLDAGRSAIAKDIPFADYTVVDDSLIPRLAGPEVVDTPADALALTGRVDNTLADVGYVGPNGALPPIPRNQSLVPLESIDAVSVGDNALPRLSASGDIEVPSGALVNTGKTETTLADVGYVDPTPGPTSTDPVIVSGTRADGKPIQGEIIEGSSEAFDNAVLVNATRADNLTDGASTAAARSGDDLLEETPSGTPVQRDADLELSATTAGANANKTGAAVLANGDTIAFPAIEDLYGFARPRSFAPVDDAIPRIAALDNEVAPVTNMLRLQPALATTPLLLGEAATDLLTPFDAGVTVSTEEGEDYTPKDDLIALATVRRGEGPWQTAERILAASGNSYDVMEVRALAKAIKALYAADPNNPDIAGLKVNHQFITDGNFQDLLDSVDNDVVKTALMSFAAA